VKNEPYSVKYVPKETCAPAFGYAKGNQAVVKEDLRPRVKRFVTAHELYHLKDKSTWGGWLGKEVRANTVVGLRDPIGLLATIAASLNKERLKFYISRFRRSE